MTKAGNVSGPQPSHLSKLDVNPSAEMIAFDLLPVKLREALNNFPMRGTASNVLDALRKGYTETQLLEVITSNSKKFGLSFLEEE